MCTWLKLWVPTESKKDWLDSRRLGFARTRRRGRRGGGVGGRQGGGTSAPPPAARSHWPETETGCEQARKTPESPYSLAGASPPALYDIYRAASLRVRQLWLSIAAALSLSPPPSLYVRALPGVADCTTTSL